MRGYLGPTRPGRRQDRARPGAIGGVSSSRRALAELFDELRLLAPRHAGGLARGAPDRRSRPSRCSAGSGSCGWRCSVGRGCSRGAGGSEADSRHPARLLRRRRTGRAARPAPRRAPSTSSGCRSVAKLYRSIFASLARVMAVDIYALNPCREYGRICSRGAAGAATRASPPAVATRQLALALDGDAAPRRPPRPIPPTEILLLALWGRPGRDSIRLYNELSDCNFDERFEDPAAGDACARRCWPRCSGRSSSARRAAATRVHRRRQPVIVPRARSAPRAGDRGRRDLAARCGTRRHAALRRLRGRRPAGGGGDLPAAGPRVFDAASDLPHTVSRSALARRGPDPRGRGAAARAADRGAGAPRAAAAGDAPGRGRAAFPTSIPRWPGALRGARHRARAPTAPITPDSYLDEDRVSWDQGLRRLALGAFLSGRRSGEERPFVLDGRAVLAGRAARRRASRPPARSGIIARELIDFARTARRADRAGRHVHGAAAARRSPRRSAPRPEEQAALGDCFARARTDRGDRAPPIWRSASASPPSWCARVWPAARRRARGRPRASRSPTFAPLRALPFRIVFVVGLDERVFPSRGRVRRARPARRRRRQPGDVTPREQDEYLFLETLLSARERPVPVVRRARRGDGRAQGSVVGVAARCSDVLASGPDGERAAVRVTPQAAAARATPTTPSAR